MTSCQLFRFDNAGVIKFPWSGGTSLFEDSSPVFHAPCEAGVEWERGTCDARIRIDDSLWQTDRPKKGKIRCFLLFIPFVMRHD